MKRFATVLALVALAACQSGPRQPMDPAQAVAAAALISAMRPAPYRPVPFYAILTDTYQAPRAIYTSCSQVGGSVNCWTN